MKIRAGLGFDIHRLEPGLPLKIGGVEIPFAQGLAGHSDGDVLLHAITDALLGAGGLGGIGERFPDTDPRYRGVASALLLSETVRVIRDAGYRIGNVDCNIIAERPRLSPYFDPMRVRIAELLHLPVADVSVKAKTMEGLGPIGAGEAIAAEAVVLVWMD